MADQGSDTDTEKEERGKYLIQVHGSAPISTSLGFLDGI
jgi:hypothetical protein